MTELISQAIDTGDWAIILIVVLGCVVVYLFKSSKEYSDNNHNETVERLEKLEDKYETEHTEFMERTKEFTNTINEIKQDIVARLDGICDKLDNIE